MENGDLATWASERSIVVLEGVLVRPQWTKKLFGKKLVPAMGWGWQTFPIKCMQDRAHRLNQPVEVVTFLGQEVVDEAAEWLLAYNVDVASIEAADWEFFCRSLAWRPDVVAVFDSEPERFKYYGQKGYAVQFGGGF